MKFTPEVLLSAPRRSAGVPNPSGTKVLYTTSLYSFETHKKTIELRLLDTKSGDSRELAKDGEVSDFDWIDDKRFFCLQAEKDGTTSLFAADASVRSGHVADSHPSESDGTSILHYVAGTIDAAAANLKVCKLDPEGNEVAVVVSALACPDGTLYTREKASKKTHSTGRLYSSLYVRHWDQYETKEQNSLWFGKLTRGDDGRYTLSKLSNALRGSTGLACPIAPFGGSDNFDIRPSGLIFVAKDPCLNPALTVKCNVYLASIRDWTQLEPPSTEEIPVSGFEGAASCPVFDAQGKKGAFLMMKDAGYEADKNRVFIISDVNVQGGQLKPQCITQESGDNHDGFWNRSPQSICFSADGKSVLAMAEDRGHGRLYKVDIEPATQQESSWEALTDQGYVSDIKPLQDGRVFISGSTLVDNSWYAIVDPASNDAKQSSSVWTQSNSASGGKYGLSPGQFSTIWTPASNPKINKEVHALVMKPSSFESGKKYPVAYLIHGGPQGSWGDTWSTRWNPAVFAEQGYIVIAPNPTGSTGYGQEFTDAIRKNWGGDPYEDIVNCFEWVGKNMPEADNDRAVALGASYGGYMMNWIQGHDLGRKFKALVCHDGILSFAGGLLSTEELYFPFHDLGGTPWYDPGFASSSSSSTSSAPQEAHRNFGPSTLSDWKRWDPSEHFANWSTPQLVIHNEKDYRLAISEGLAAFNVLQARGVESKFLMFPDENHFVLKPENSLVWHKVVLNWINHYAGLPPYTTESEDSEEFWGGLREGSEEMAQMPAAGKPET